MTVRINKQKINLREKLAETEEKVNFDEVVRGLGENTASLILNKDGGNVGIGTTSPDAKLEVYQDLNTSSGASILKVTNTRLNTGSSSSVISLITDEVDGNTADERVQLAGSYDGINGGKLDILTNTGSSLSPAVTIKHNGNVGIGTTSPNAKLEIEKNSYGSLAAGQGHIVLDTLGAAREKDEGPFINFRVPTTSSTSEDMANIGAVCSDDTPSSRKADLVFWTRNNTFSEKMRITSGGNVGIGTTSPSAVFHVDKESNLTKASPHFKIRGSGYTGFHWLSDTAYYIGQDSDGRSIRIFSGSSTTTGVELTNGSNSWATFSDERLKENITNLDSVIDKVKDIRCVSYTRSDVENSKEAIGFIAQDFIGKFDQVLNKSKISDEDEEEYYSIKYTETIPVLMKAIQEQQQLIDDLKSRIETLEQQ